MTKSLFSKVYKTRGRAYQRMMLGIQALQNFFKILKIIFKIFFKILKNYILNLTFDSHFRLSH